MKPPRTSPACCLNVAPSSRAAPQAIYAKYVARGAAEEVNLPVRYRNAPFDPAAHVELLTRAQQEVITMMALDAFPRFLRSRYCDRMLDELAKQPAASWGPAAGFGAGSPTVSPRAGAGVATDAAGAPPLPGATAAGTSGSGGGGSALFGDVGARAILAASHSEAAGPATAAATTPSRRVDAFVKASASTGGHPTTSDDESTIFSSLDLMSNLRAARLKLRQGKGRWMEVFQGVADVLPVCIVIADVSVSFRGLRKRLPPILPTHPPTPSLRSPRRLQMRLPGVPIVYANAAFYSTTGYPPAEVLGRNCRFLQGPGTDQGTVERLRDAIRNGREIHCEILNYRRDGASPAGMGRGRGGAFGLESAAGRL